MIPEKVPRTLQMAPELSRPVEFASVFREQFSYVWNTLTRMGIAARDLEDLTHDVFLNVYRQLGSYDATRPLRPWLFGFAFRMASDYRRLARHRRELVGVAAEPSDRAPLADAALISAEERALVETALQHVKLDRRAVLMLHDIDGFSIPEVAESLSLPLNTAYSRLRVARDDLRSALQKLQKQGSRHAK
jgi:RNA polymerase sigma-70 factor, ECF subfamily